MIHNRNCKLIDIINSNYQYGKNQLNCLSFKFLNSRLRDDNYYLLEQIVKRCSQNLDIFVKIIIQNFRIIQDDLSGDEILVNKRLLLGGGGCCSASSKNKKNNQQIPVPEAPQQQETKKPGNEILNNLQTLPFFDIDEDGASPNKEIHQVQQAPIEQFIHIKAAIEQQNLQDITVALSELDDVNLESVKAPVLICYELINTIYTSNIYKKKQFGLTILQIWKKIRILLSQRHLFDISNLEYGYIKKNFKATQDQIKQMTIFQEMQGILDIDNDLLIELHLVDQIIVGMNEKSLYATEYDKLGVNLVYTLWKLDAKKQSSTISADIINNLRALFEQNALIFSNKECNILLEQLTRQDIIRILINNPENIQLCYDYLIKQISSSEFWQVIYYSIGNLGRLMALEQAQVDLRIFILVGLQTNEQQAIQIQDKNAQSNVPIIQNPNEIQQEQQPPPQQYQEDDQLQYNQQVNNKTHSDQLDDQKQENEEDLDDYDDYNDNLACIARLGVTRYVKQKVNPQILKSLLDNAWLLRLQAISQIINLLNSSNKQIKMEAYKQLADVFIQECHPRVLMIFKNIPDFSQLYVQAKEAFTLRKNYLLKHLKQQIYGLNALLHSTNNYITIARDLLEKIRAIEQQIKKVNDINLEKMQKDDTYYQSFLLSQDKKKNFDQLIQQLRKRVSDLKTADDQSMMMDYYIQPKIAHKDGSNANDYIYSNLELEVLNNVFFSIWSSYKQVQMLEGKRGIGKTLLLKHLFYNLVDSYEANLFYLPFPIYLNLKEFKQGQLLDDKIKEFVGNDKIYQEIKSIGFPMMIFLDDYDQYINKQQNFLQVIGVHDNDNYFLTVTADKGTQLNLTIMSSPDQIQKQYDKKNVSFGEYDQEQKIQMCRNFFTIANLEQNSKQLLIQQQEELENQKNNNNNKQKQTQKQPNQQQQTSCINQKQDNEEQKKEEIMKAQVLDFKKFSDHIKDQTKFLNFLYSLEPLLQFQLLFIYLVCHKSNKLQDVYAIANQSQLMLRFCQIWIEEFCIDNKALIQKILFPQVQQKGQKALQVQAQQDQLALQQKTVQDQAKQVVSDFTNCLQKVAFTMFIKISNVNSMPIKDVDSQNDTDKLIFQLISEIPKLPYQGMVKRLAPLIPSEQEAVKFRHSCLFENLVLSQMFGEINKALASAEEEKAQEQAIITVDQQPGTNTSSSSVVKIIQTSIFNRQMLTEASLQHLAHQAIEIIKDNIELHTHLMKLIQLSRYSKDVTISSANAITLLNYAGHNFFKEDLSGICIQNADLRGASCNFCNFQHADLSNVDFTSASLFGANLDGANLLNTQFGEMPELQGHQDCVNNVCFSPDGQIIVSGSEDGIIKVWKFIDLTEIKTIQGHEGNVRAICFSIDGKIFMTGGNDAQINLWSVETFDLITSLPGHSESVSYLYCSADGQYLLSASDDRSVKVWSLKQFNQYISNEDHDDMVTSVCCTTNFQYILSGSCDNSVKIWNTTEQRLISTILSHSGNVISVFCVQNDKYFVYGSDDNYIMVYSMDNFKLVKTLLDQKEMVKSPSVQLKTMRYCQPRQKLAAVFTDNTIKIWNLESFTLYCTILGKTGQSNILAITISPDGLYLLAGCQNNKIQIWSVDQQLNAIQDTIGHTGHINAVCGTNNGELLISGGSDQDLKIWSTKDYSLVSTLKDHTDIIRSVCCLPNGKHCASGCDDDTIKLWDLQNFSLVHTFTGHKGMVRQVCCSPDSQHLISCSDDNTVIIWNVEKKLMVANLQGHNGSVKTVSISPDGQIIVSAGDDTQIKVWQFSTWIEKRTIAGHLDTINHICHSSKGIYAISCSNDNTIRIWQANQNYIPYATLNLENQENVLCVVCTNDEKYIIAGQNSMISLWDIANKVKLSQFQGHKDKIVNLCLMNVVQVVNKECESKTYLVSSGLDKSIMIWLLETDEQQTQGICLYLKKRLSKYSQLETKQLSFKDVINATTTQIMLLKQGAQ